MNVVLSLPESAKVASITVVMDNVTETHVQAVICDPKETSAIVFTWGEDPKKIERIQE